MQRFEPDTFFQHCYSGPRRDYFDADGCVRYGINNRGYRGPDFDIDKPPDTYRVVVLGDSFTFGEGVPEPDVFPARLAAELKQGAGSKRVEVIKLGIPVADDIEAIDLKPHLAAQRDRDLWVHETDHHPNPTAQGIAARALAERAPIAR